MVWQVRLRAAIQQTRRTTTQRASSRKLTNTSSGNKWEHAIDSLVVARAGSTWCGGCHSGRRWSYSSRAAERRTNVVSSSAPFSTDAATETEKPLIPGVGKAKTSTGLVGLPVDHEAIPKIIALNQALLDKMAASDMPETAQYRINVEAICRYRIQVCQEHPDDPEKVEELIDCGQVEELVVQAKDEMEVLDMYLENRIWELIRPNEVEVMHEADPMVDETMDEEEEKEK